MADRPAIDLAQLGTYTAGDRDLERELLELFVPNAEGYIDAMAAGGGAPWSAAAHGLKGVAKGVGAWQLAELAEAAEALSEASPGDRAAAVAGLRAAHGRVRSFVADLD
ncbi:MAG: Hpt domain-containing protein [Alphaproteobacteria bacterium]|nr:Hpt domain-containing protein [Alphaproteobacteria bacterium]MDP6814261.1 Hpt domain-containing protein [Alphaproteobacteria bacterium]